MALITPAAAAAAVNNLRAARAFQLSAFIILIFDHAITFGDEVERIWKRSWHFPTYLFFLNRYATPLVRTIIVVAFNDPLWPTESCKRFVKFEGGSAMVLVAIAEMVMILRVYALYSRSKIVLAILLVSLVGQIFLMAFSLAATQPEPLLPGLTACILVGKTGSNLFAGFWGASLWTDTLVFFFTLFKVIQLRRRNMNTPIMSILARDGLLYFFVIFFANFFNTVMYLSAPLSIKAIGASFSQLITATMISRLQLNLRSVNTGATLQVEWNMGKPAFPRSPPAYGSSNYDTSRKEIQSSTVTRWLGNLGESLEPVEKSTHWSPDTTEVELKEVL